MDALEQHALHLLALVLIPPAVIAIWNAVDNIRDGVWPMPSRTVLVGTFASASAGWVHVVVAPSHVADGLATFGFFVVISVAQLAWAWRMAVRCTPGLMIAGAVLNASIVVVWAVSRLNGAPIGIVDGLATVLEIVVLGTAMTLWQAHVQIHEPVAWPNSRSVLRGGESRRRSQRAHRVLHLRGGSAALRVRHGGHLRVGRGAPAEDGTRDAACAVAGEHDEFRPSIMNISADETPRDAVGGVG
jgi:hypothetical protein